MIGKVTVTDDGPKDGIRDPTLEPICILYRNYKGEVAYRRVTPLRRQLRRAFL